MRASCNSITGAALALIALFPSVLCTGRGHSDTIDVLRGAPKFLTRKLFPSAGSDASQRFTPSRHHHAQEVSERYTTRRTEEVMQRLALGEGPAEDCPRSSYEVYTARNPRVTYPRTECDCQNCWAERDIVVPSRRGTESRVAPAPSRRVRVQASSRLAELRAQREQVLDKLVSEPIGNYRYSELIALGNELLQEFPKFNTRLVNVENRPGNKNVKANDREYSEWYSYAVDVLSELMNKLEARVSYAIRDLEHYGDVTSSDCVVFKKCHNFVRAIGDNLLNDLENAATCNELNTEEKMEEREVIMENFVSLIHVLGGLYNALPGHQAPAHSQRFRM